MLSEYGVERECRVWSLQLEGDEGMNEEGVRVRSDGDGEGEGEGRWREIGGDDGGGEGCGCDELG